MNQVSKDPQPGLHPAGLERIQQWMQSYLDRGKSAGMLRWYAATVKLRI